MIFRVKRQFFFVEGQNHQARLSTDRLGLIPIPLPVHPDTFVLMTNSHRMFLVVKNQNRSFTVILK